VTRFRLLLPALALLGWSSGAEARRMPDRAQVARALDAWFACRPVETCRGISPLHFRLTTSHCIRLPWDEAHPGRILCTFSGADTARGRRPNRFRNECIYLMPTRRSWEVSSIPDGMC
jgi:hypothetical protein